MIYDSITIDTNIFVKNGFNLEGGILARLSQFQEIPSEFVLSEIVLNEMYLQMLEKTRASRESLSRELKRAIDLQVVDFKMAHLSELIEIKSAKDSDVVNSRINKFLLDSNCTQIPAENTDIKNLVRSYFESKPAFERVGKKKNEFPDAIALLSLEEWAKSKSKKILAVSDDSGWANFAHNSQFIDVESDLASVLEKFQSYIDIAVNVADSFLEEVAGDSVSAFKDEFLSILGAKVGDMDFAPDAESDLQFVAGYPEVRLEEFTVGHYNEERPFKVVQFGSSRLFIQVDIIIYIEAECQFSFEIWDSVDRETVHVGSTTEIINQGIEISILLQLQGKFSAEVQVVEAIELDIVENFETIDFGYISLERGE